MYLANKEDVLLLYMKSWLREISNFAVKSGIPHEKQNQTARIFNIPRCVGTFVWFPAISVVSLPVQETYFNDHTLDSFGHRIYQNTLKIQNSFWVHYLTDAHSKSNSVHRNGETKYRKHIFQLDFA